MIRFFSDQAYLYSRDIAQSNALVRPFFRGSWINENSPSWKKQYIEYEKDANSFFKLTKLEEADYFILPDDWRSVSGEVWYNKKNKDAESLNFKFANLARRAGKPLIIFFGGDLSSRNISIKDAYVFRHSCYTSRRKSKDFVWPAFCEDLLSVYCDGKVQLRGKSHVPTVGFCGLVKDSSWKMKSKNLIFHMYTLATYGQLEYPPAQGHVLRRKALEMLSKSSMVKTNFIIRNRMVFLGESKKGASQHVIDYRSEFVENLLGSDYIFCCRGAGNFSNRLFESLCCGRIPILVNTDCALPYDFRIDWKKYCIWVEESEMHLIAEKVAAFHEKLSEQEFIDLQIECRNLWEEWLSTKGYFSKFYLHFQ